MITSLFAIKVVAALAILVMGIIGGIIPLLVARHDTSRRFMSMGNALAGGIFLGAGFMHLLPEAGEALEGLIDYPLASLLAAVGVLVLLLIDPSCSKPTVHKIWSRVGRLDSPSTL